MDAFYYATDKQYAIYMDMKSKNHMGVLNSSYNIQISSTMRQYAVRVIIIFLSAMSFAPAVSAQDRNLRLWYDKPANVWESALPIGNGRLGAMIFGGVENELIQLNEHTVWSGSPHRNDNPKALTALPEIRALILNGQFKEAERIANDAIISKGSHGQKFQPVSDVLLNFQGNEHYADYTRELDIAQAIMKVSYKVGDVKYEREYFASLTDSVIVMRMTADTPGKISFSVRVKSPHVKTSMDVSNDAIVLKGTTSDHEGVVGRIQFCNILKLKHEGGRIAASDSSVMVNDADAVTLVISIATNFKSYKDLSGDGVGRAEKMIANSLHKTYQNLRADHIKKYQQYFNRVKLNLETPAVTDLPTDQRLNLFRTSNDLAFVALYFQYGRYLLISSSQPGGQPANLQGIWNNKMSPPWDSKYTININAEMNYWPAEKTNLSELHEPFLKMVTELAQQGRETARVMYGARGWTAHHNTDIWRTTGAVDGALWGIWNGGGGWTSQHLWEHYLYSGDHQFLEKIYPVLKESARFYADFIVEHPVKKWLVVNPGMSPENSPEGHDGASIDAGTTMDNQIVFDVFSTTIRAAQLLKRDPAFVDSLKKLRTKLPPMQVGQHGQLQEWLDDLDNPNDKHRHISHLYGLYPSNQISPYRTPELYNAAKIILQQRGDVSTGWSMGWKVNWWARLLDGNHAFKLIKDQLTPVGTNEGGGGTYANLFDAHPPFQIDGNFGCTSGIAEMLVQSANGEIHLLPALPEAWPTGVVSGIRARGGFEIVELKWNNGKVSKLVIKSALGGNLRIRLPNTVSSDSGRKLKPAKGSNPNSFYFVENIPAPRTSPKATTATSEMPATSVYDVSTAANQLYTFVAQ
jgi:alpha-L-fucosidase 2